MESASCDIMRLPRELLAVIVSLTSPPDACRAAAVSRAFCAAADSDAVWSCFLPSDLPRFAEGELPPIPPSTKKGTFLRLSRRPVLLPCRLRCMWLDKFSGAKCYTLLARALRILRSDTPDFWEWIHIDVSETNTRPFEAAKLILDIWLKIHGTIHSRMLSRNTTYGVYLVFKLASAEFFGMDFPFQEASVSAGGSESTRQVCVQGYDTTGRDDWMPLRHIFGSRLGNKVYNYALPLTDDIILPRYKKGGWMELELGEFYNKEGYDGKVSVSLTETKGFFKSGLIVAGIQIRSKH